MNWFVLAWARATEFSGRSRRKEYWMFSLINALVAIALIVVLIILGKSDSGRVFSYLVMTYMLISAIPSWSCSVRLLHDTGRSGWWLLLNMVPVIGLIVLVFLVLDSEPDRNQYGPNPKPAQPAAWTI